ncbi:nicotinate (nicotinamide) nucleotide adenylyltransferase [Fulvivirgaceae bacterium BMA10]|uniref:Probable nicotinate-nucleotide adenylyltransferase n=1 Tax=Splendidivirga corallicola TaxID=3051826 RepID=A0ABT8KWL4_9BACT|nr:nicotinate (nicotinamide) nucleotide adenylyltransferase [Fulvivirgaceae bacterium BMA10]
MKIGLFFGSFNPIHLGHLIIANVMVESTDMKQVWFVVSPQNPFKSSRSLLHEFDRLKMVEAAINDNYNLRACNVEFGMPKPSYTVDTLAYLSDKYPQHDFKLIIGEDNLPSFPKWKNHQVILEQFGVYVYPRPDAGHSKLKEHPNVRFVNAPLLNISATFIRDNVKKGRSIKYLVHEDVETYIQSHNLFL